MKIAVSADCFAAFTSGFPVRGMMLELIRKNPEIEFLLYYTKRKWPAALHNFYNEINSLPNVEIRFFKDNQKVIAIKRLLCLKYLKCDPDVDLFMSPGNPEFIKGFHGPTICSLADLSTIKGISTNKYALFFKYWTKYQWKVILPKISRIVTISDYTGKDVSEYFPSVKNQIVTIHNGIDNFWFKSNNSLTSYADRFGLKGDYFIWWGLISRRKNIARLIEAYKIAKSKHNNLPKLLLVGSLAEHMENLRNEFCDDIINIGFQNQEILKSLVSKSRGLIFPSLYEGFGLPVVEAFSQGINVACSNITSLPEVAGGNAILFDPMSIDSIADAIIKLAKKPRDSENLKNYAKNYTYSEAAKNYLKIIHELVQ